MNLGAIGFPRWLSLRLRGRRIESAPLSPAIKLTWRNRSTWANSSSWSRTWWDGRSGRGSRVLLRLGHPFQRGEPEIVTAVHQGLVAPAQGRRILADPGLIHHDMA